MIIILFLNCINLIVNQRIEQNYQKVNGIQVFQIRNLTQNDLPDKQKIILTLIYKEGELPILLLCPNKPEAKMSMDYDSITKEQCHYDVNAYENNKKTQVFSLQNKFTIQKYHKNFNIYELQENGQFIGAISNQTSSYSIQAEIQSQYACQKECRNGGSCFYGVCECLQGTFGDDCSIQGLNILEQQVLQSNHLYYLDIRQLVGNNFLRILSNSIQLRQQCYADKPQINHGIQILTNLLQIDNNRLEYCKNITIQVQNQLKIEQYPHYLFKIIDQNNVEVFDNNVKKEDISNIMVILLISLLTLFLLCLCSRMFKKNSDSYKQQIKTESTQNYVDLYIPTQKFSDIKDNEGPFIDSNGQQCSICLERFDLLNNVKITYCKHLYHSKCLKIWIEKIKICPLCRAPLDEQTIISMQRPKTLTIIDQITNKSSNKFQSSLGSLVAFNYQNDTKFQNQNYQRSLVCIDQ